MGFTIYHLVTEYLFIIRILLTCQFLSCLLHKNFKIVVNVNKEYCTSEQQDECCVAVGLASSCDPSILYQGTCCSAAGPAHGDPRALVPAAQSEWSSWLLPLAWPCLSCYSCSQNNPVERRFEFSVCPPSVLLLAFIFLSNK